MAQLAAGGELEPENAREELAQAALKAGLEPDEIRATVESGWKAGEQKPRQAPDPGEPDESEAERAAVERAGGIIADPAELLDAVLAFYRRFIVMTDDAAVTCALWTAHAHAFEASDFTPYLFVTSAERESGKSKLKEVAELLVPRPVSSLNISPAAVFTVAAQEPPPTLLVDEVDEIFAAKSERSELRGLLNGGFRRGEKAIRVDMSNGRKLETFDVYCPKLLAGKSSARLGDTLESRCVRLELRKKLRTEHVERFRRRLLVDEATRLRVSLATFAEEHTGALGQAYPDMPEALSDRGQDIWEPLLAIADLVGGRWPELAREAAVRLAEVEQEESLAVQLLRDVRAVFGTHEAISTENLIRQLCEQDESPWAGWWLDAGGYPRSEASYRLARMLRPFGVRPRQPYIDGKRVRGYERAAFADAWARHLPPE